MRAGWAAALAVLLGSCGLETVPSLASPQIDIFDSSLNPGTSVSFLHDASRYSGSDFQGYKIYYKIYALANPTDLARLQSDRDLLTSPTVTQLATLGYRTFTFSSSNTGTSAGVEELFVPAPADGAKITLDFAAFLTNSSSTTTPPLLEIDDVTTSKPYLYRTSALVGTAEQTFHALRSTATISQDMSVTEAERAAHQFELNIFVAAYGLTSALVEVYSSPVPWGVIRTIQP